MYTTQSALIPQRLLLTDKDPPRRIYRVIRRSHEQNGSEKFASESDEKSAFIEMTVASKEYTQLPTKLRVPDPTKRKPRSTSKRETPASIPPTPDRSLSKSAVSDSALQRRNRELAAANLTIQSQEKELKMLRQSMGEMEKLFEKLKVERISYRQKLESKDCQLTEAYQSLVEAAEERTNLHQELFELEQELLDLRRGKCKPQEESVESSLRLSDGEEVESGEMEEVSMRLEQLSELSSQFVEDAVKDEEDLSGLNP